MAKLKFSAEFILLWMHSFCKLNVSKRERRQMLIDTFIDAVYLYDNQ